MKMVPRTLGATSAFVIASSMTSIASAAHERVLVAGAGDDPFIASIEQELKALGFEAVRGSAASGCSPAAVEEEAQRANARAATCVAQRTIVIWSVGPDFLHLEDIVRARDEDARGPAGAAVRVAEVTRASLSLTSHVDEQLALRPAPRETSDAEVSQLLARDTLPTERSKNGPERGFLSLGVDRLLNEKGLDSTLLDVQLGLALARRFEPRLRMLAPVAASEGSGHLIRSVSPTLFMLGARVPLLDRGHPIRIHVGAGVGAAYLSTSTFIVSSGTQRAHAALTSFAMADATLGVRLMGPVHFAVDGALGVSGEAVTLLAEGNAATWGRPVYAAGSRIEVVFR
jgi:hypothetical protein